MLGANDAPRMRPVLTAPDSVAWTGTSNGDASKDARGPMRPVLTALEELRAEGLYLSATVANALLCAPLCALAVTRTI